MPEERVPSKRELLAALRASRDEVLTTVRALPPERLDEGRYENGVEPEVLAHRDVGLDAVAHDGGIIRRHAERRRARPRR